ncbi:tetratricopeptide repeat protein [Stappia taiwanensis]|uniref:Ancillary SecYEG translocon subunit n=1 Tax=Stappia taiwanensis TaxID=992267 RepID=A0A838XTC6_9HYPH|nr:tetratricopeptide repeat protein [Stappia taiwanensis]MBA4613685.1 tetratricopeptide repeat protein [Stappia taiwanensis]GGE81443.1 membrane protein [Stappia taiwanensis]
MSDIFREVDEEIRHERYKRLWDRFGPWLIALALVVVVGTAAYRGWLYWLETEAQKSGDVFIKASELAEDGKLAEAQELLASLTDAQGGYPALATLRAAGVQAEAGDKAEAMAAFDAFAASSGEDALLRNVARLRAGYLALELGDFTGAADRLEPLTGPDSAWRFLAGEALALAAWKNGNSAEARRRIEEITESAEAPSDVVARVGTVLDLLNAAEGTPDKKAESQ